MKRTLSYRQALNEAMALEMARDPEVFVFGLDVDDHKRIFGSTNELVEKFGADRVMGTPLSEEAMTGLALGAALEGMRPIHVHIRADFLFLALNQIANMISIARYMAAGQVNVPLVIRAVVGRGWGQSAQHSKSMHSILAHLPGIKVTMPATPNEARGMLISAIRDDNPVIQLEHRWLYDVEGPVDTHTKGLPMEQHVVLRSGSDMTIVATSWMSVEAMHAAEILSRRSGVELEVVNARCAAPLDDTVMLSSVEKTRSCIVADNDWLHCGLSAEIAARVMTHCFGRLNSPVERIGWAPTPCPTTRCLENEFYANARNIIRAVEKMLKLRPLDLSEEDFYSHERGFKGPF